MKRSAQHTQFFKVEDDQLQVHALRSLPPGAAAVLGAARGLAVALAVAAGA